MLLVSATRQAPPLSIWEKPTSGPDGARRQPSAHHSAALAVRLCSNLLLERAACMVDHPEPLGPTFPTPWKTAAHAIAAFWRAFCGKGVGGEQDRKKRPAGLCAAPKA